jgi:predicted transcriptional regulator
LVKNQYKGVAMENESEGPLALQRTAEIVAAYVRNNQLSGDQLASLISTVHQTLGQLGKPGEPVEERTPAVPIRRSVHQDYVICLDCGWRGKMLRRHISSAHELTAAGYRERWGLSREHVLTAPAYAEQRSALAKQLGLGRRRRPEAEAQPEPKKRSSRRGRRQAEAASTA